MGNYSVTHNNVLDKCLFVSFSNAEAFMSMWLNFGFEEWTGNPVHGMQSPSPPNGFQVQVQFPVFFSPQICDEPRSFFWNSNPSQIISEKDRIICDS